MSTSRRTRWVLATSNTGKVAEFNALLDLPALELVPLAALGIPGASEHRSTFVENAITKARHACARTGLPALADDSGLVVPTLDGAPGIRSARFAGTDATDQDNVALLLARLAGTTGDGRRATFHCVLVALTSAVDPVPVIAHGAWSGFIAESPRGTRGFGYDPVFVDPESGRTAAELTAAEKNTRSHRANAIVAIRPTLDMGLGGP